MRPRAVSAKGGERLLAVTAREGHRKGFSWFTCMWNGLHSCSLLVGPAALECSPFQRGNEGPQGSDSHGLCVGFGGGPAEKLNLSGTSSLALRRFR